MHTESEYIVTPKNFNLYFYIIIKLIFQTYVMKVPKMIRTINKIAIENYQYSITRKYNCC